MHHLCEYICTFLWTCLKTADWRRALSVGQCQGQAEGICLCSTPTSFPLSRRSGGTQPSRLTPNLFPGLVCNKMPFPTRPLQPPSLGKSPPPPGEDPLQWVTNQNLCQAMRQLVSLLKQADSVFGDLEVRGEGCVLTVLGWVLFCHGSSQCDPWAAQTPGFNDCRT